MAAYPDGGGSVAFREAQGRLLRARLAARGLVRTSPSVRIREIAADAPDRDRRPTSPLAWIEPPADQPAVEIAKSDLDPEPDGPRSSVQCPSCRQSQQVAVEATGYRCLSCGRVWRWAVCHSCDRLAMTVAHQESWQCTCGSFTRSWWRTDTAAREGPRVVTRRRDETIRIQRELAVSRAGRRRWKLIASGLAAVLVAAGVAVVVTTGGSDSEAGATTAACSHFERVRSGIVNGEIDASELRMTLAAIRSEAEGAEAGVRVAARRLAAVGAPGTADFLVAQTEMADACESAGA